MTKQTNKMTTTSITQGRKETTSDGSQGKLLGREILDPRPNEKEIQQEKELDDP